MRLLPTGAMYDSPHLAKEGVYGPPPLEKGG
jgi:hypothetical protein